MSVAEPWSRPAVKRCEATTGGRKRGYVGLRQARTSMRSSASISVTISRVRSTRYGNTYTRPRRPRVRGRTGRPCASAHAGPCGTGRVRSRPSSWTDCRHVFRGCAEARREWRLRRVDALTAQAVALGPKLALSESARPRAGPPGPPQGGRRRACGGAEREQAGPDGCRRRRCVCPRA